MDLEVNGQRSLHPRGTFPINTLINLAHYVAPAATMIAACMTAANLGPRVTGWGFIIFTLGSLAWSCIAITSGQHSLLLTNGFLTLVNVIGIWRWLGRVARFDEGAKAAETKSKTANTPTLINIGSIEGRAVVDSAGLKIGNAIGVMASANTGTIAYVVASLGGISGIGERLIALPWDSLELAEQSLAVTLDESAIAGLPDLDPIDWPTSAQLHHAL